MLSLSRPGITVSRDPRRAKGGVKRNTVNPHRSSPRRPRNPLTAISRGRYVVRDLHDGRGARSRRVVVKLGSWSACADGVRHPCRAPSFIARSKPTPKPHCRSQVYPATGRPGGNGPNPSERPERAPAMIIPGTTRRGPMFLPKAVRQADFCTDCRAPARHDSTIVAGGPREFHPIRRNPCSDLRAERATESSSCSLYAAKTCMQRHRFPARPDRTFVSDEEPTPTLSYLPEKND